MGSDKEREADLAAQLHHAVEHALPAGERLGYATWVTRSAGRRQTGDTEAAAVEELLAEPATALVLAITDTRLLLLREIPVASGRQGMMDAFREQMADLVSSRPAVPRPTRPLEPVWQRSRTCLAGAKARWGAFADRVVLSFTDGSRIGLTAPHVTRLAAALTTR